jgi:hypothetical protein
MDAFHERPLLPPSRMLADRLKRKRLYLAEVAAFYCTRIELFETLEEFAGYKAGLVLSRDEIRTDLPEAEELDGDDTMVLRIRYEELEALVRDLLFALGTLKHRPGFNPMMDLHAKYRRNTLKSRIVRTITEEFVQCNRRSALSVVRSTSLRFSNAQCRNTVLPVSKCSSSSMSSCKSTRRAASVLVHDRRIIGTVLFGFGDEPCAQRVT